ncbi:MAG TPA: hypothetical protein VNE40_04260 [Candidatus Dormibacteraeota bacterium]|nr:hypothetical protein [Candidatus Dormibacteraeota bacterium]
MTEIITGSETVDVLQGLQKVVNSMSSIGQRIEHLKRTINFIRAGKLFGNHFLVDAFMAIGKEEGMADQEYALYHGGLTFIGQLNTFGYFQDTDVPLDSLTLNFSDPELLVADQRDDLQERILRLQVPVLAIGTCLDLEEGS